MRPTIIYSHEGLNTCRGGNSVSFPKTSDTHFWYQMSTNLLRIWHFYNYKYFGGKSTTFSITILFECDLKVEKALFSHSPQITNGIHVHTKFRANQNLKKIIFFNHNDTQISDNHLNPVMLVLIGKLSLSTGR